MKTLKDFLVKEEKQSAAKSEDTISFSKDELFEHLDIQNRGKVDIYDYVAHVMMHANHPEYLASYLDDLNPIQKKYALGESTKKDDILTELKENASLIIEDTITETTHLHDRQVDPPAVLIMRRKSIRQFPDGKRVALYYVDKLNKYVTVPYENMQWGKPTGGLPEMEEKRAPVFSLVKEIAQSNKGRIVEHTDGTTSEITVDMAQQLLKLHKRINDDNKRKMEDMLDASTEHFNTIINFSKG